MSTSRVTGGYRGTIALNVSVPGRHAELVLVAFDLWENCVVLRGRATLDLAYRFWPPSSWWIRTDVGSMHSSGGGGGSSMAWGYHLEPTIADPARELQIFAGPDGKPPGREAAIPDEPTVVVRLPPWKAVTQQAVVSLVAESQPTSSLGAMPNIQEPVRPVAVLAVSARLGELAGRDLCVLSIEQYPDWFFLHFGGSGALERPVPGTRPRLLGRRCTAQDDRGGRYEGRVKSSHSGFPWYADAPFSPALDPRARQLTVTFPHPFVQGTVRTSFVLPEE